MVHSDVSVALRDDGLLHEGLATELSVSKSAVEVEDVPVLSRVSLVESIATVSVVAGSQSEHSVVPASRWTSMELLDSVVVWVGVVGIHNIQVGGELGVVWLRPG